MALIALLLAIASIVEKMYGTAYAYEHLYGSPVTVMLWAIMACSALIYIVQCGVWRKRATLLLHLSFGIILLGALTTHLTARQGQMHLRRGEVPVKHFVLDSGAPYQLPFKVTLREFRMEYYPGTFAPMDYVSTLDISDGAVSFEGVVSMNNILSYRSYRLYQSGYDPDGEGTTLCVSYDPYGIATTYVGYGLLLLSMLLFFFEPRSRFRTLWRSATTRKLTILIFAICASTGPLSAQEHTPPSVPHDVAEAFGNLHIYYNDRICPMQTLARDLTTKLYGKPTYKGLSAEQVMCGWLLFTPKWQREPMLKIKNKQVQQLLGVEGKYASIADFIAEDGDYKLTPALQNLGGEYEPRQVAAANEKFNLVSMLCTGSMLRIFPYGDGREPYPVWYSPVDALPEGIGSEEALLIRGSIPLVAQSVERGDYTQALSLLKQIREYQLLRAGSHAPSEARFRAERLYNTFSWSRPLSMLCLTLGIIAFLLRIARRSLSARTERIVEVVLGTLIVAVEAYLTLHIALRWYISDHVPLSNGFETMQFMAWASLMVALLLQRRFRMAQPFGLLLCGFTLLVAMMGEANPRITQLMPVLQSPLLSIHVVVIMVAYSLFAFMMLNGVTAFALRLTRPHKEAMEEALRLQRASNLMLYPAIFLLTAGIFIGAVWANISWGRYWGWDPKEVWALITMLIYAFGLHGGSIPTLRRPMAFHLFCILAFLSVLVTYFGVNMLLGGMHSYA